MKLLCHRILPVALSICLFSTACDRAPQPSDTSQEEAQNTTASKQSAAADTPTAISPASYITRDIWQTPIIHTPDLATAFRAYGYALAQDRLFQLEMLRRTTQGRVAEVLGKDFYALDERTLSHYDLPAIRTQVQRLSATDRRLLQAYIEGFNAWVAKVNADPGQWLPAEFSYYDFAPQEWQIFDLVMIFVGSMAHRYADFNEELGNLEFFIALQEQHGLEHAWKIFAATMPLYDAASPVTVPVNESVRQRGAEHPEPPPYIERLQSVSFAYRREVFATSGRFQFISEDENYRQYLRTVFAHSGSPGAAGFSSASNIWLLRGDKLADADAVMVNGPQFGWSLPGYVYAASLHAGDRQISGNTLYGYPAFLFAHNGKIAWGSTAGMGDLVDVFMLQLNPDNPEEYLFKDEYIPLQKRPFEIPVKGESLPRQGVAYRSHYGMVVQHDAVNGIAFTKQRSWEGSEVKSLLAWMRITEAQNYEQFRQIAADISFNINFYYLDSDANIAYLHLGKYPRRHPQHDHRLPVLGNGSYDWQGFLPFSENPQVFNPAQGYLQNWNNRPERNWPSSDLWWANWAGGHRAAILEQALQAQPTFTVAESWQLNRRAAHYDVNADFLLPPLLQAFSENQPPAVVAAALAALQEWQCSWLDQDRDGYFDHAANLIMHRWLQHLLQQVFSDDIAAEYLFRFAATGYPVSRQIASIRVQAGTRIIIRQLTEAVDSLSYDFFNGVPADEVLRGSFAETVLSLQEEYGDNLENWRIQTYPLQFAPYNFRGVPQALPDARVELGVIMNRGSENNQFVAREGKISASDVLPPAQSGFLPPGKTATEYPQEQLPLYDEYRLKPIPAQ